MDSSSSGLAAFLVVYFIVMFAVMVIGIVAAWKVYAKAGRHGWAALIPFYNIYVLMEVVGRPGWWLILYFIPIVNIVISLIVSLDLAHSFAKSTAFGVVGLWLFSLIGWLMLGFGSARYVGPAASHSAGPTPAGGHTAVY